MKDNINSSLLTKNKITKISDEEYLRQHDYLETVSAFARLTYESVYVIDYEKMAFEYVSENPLFLCGYSPAEVLNLGYEFYFKNVPEKDLALLNLINEAGFDFFARLPAEEKKLYSISYDFHLINQEGKPMLINHRLTPLFLSTDEKIWKAMCIVSISNHQDAGNVFIYKQGADEVWELDVKDNIWRKSEKAKLSSREIEILRLHAQGLTINQIAEKIFVVPDTVKYYRRRIFERLGVSNMVEALSYAVNSRII
ncbi:response regulator transcription factor [Pedobacter sp. UBA5917]|jgi:DNA-binding CsgD family transcriptional regulator|uniref:response regulator transcription factor n=1 Tax=Pedobacter sp. UBA5917 TaxID=1947061 RepID=UPI0025CB7DDD|nr:helix-turn-helix transcriptional regulator [Pedobacter sp. UBA5917]